MSLHEALQNKALYQPSHLRITVQGALKRGRWEDLHYKGDWMRRPISSNEIGWLVRLLLRLSSLLNHLLYLDGQQPPAPSNPNFAVVRGTMCVCFLVIEEQFDCW